MTPFEAERISRWSYPAPYGMYSLRPADAAMLLDPNLNYLAVYQGAELAGFACFGEDAQVVGGEYDESALDFGCGMEPARTGMGLGRAFVGAIIDYARATWEPPALRLSVASVNRRAVAVYRRNGFRTIGWFAGTTRHGTAPFQTMILRQPTPHKVTSPGE